LRHHQVDRLLLRPGQRTRLEDRAPRADEIEESVFLDMPFEKRPVGRVAVDVTFFDLDTLLPQKTSGVSAGYSGGLPVESRF